MKKLLFLTVMAICPATQSFAQVQNETNNVQYTDSLSTDISADSTTEVLSPDTITPVEQSNTSNDNLLKFDEEDNNNDKKLDYNTDDEPVPELKKDPEKTQEPVRNNDELLYGNSETTTSNQILGRRGQQSELGEVQAHFNKVWSYRGYLNLSWNNTSIKPKEDIKTGFNDYNDGLVPDFKSNWAASLTLGRNYKLHKHPIGNVLQFYIDYTGIDLGINHFKMEDGIEGKVYNSGATWQPEGEKNSDSYKYLPWNVEKFEIAYGMNVGPSFTLAPFTHVNNRNWHFLKLNVYYHIGYSFSFLFLSGDDDADVASDMKSNVINWGHGLTHTFGVCLSYKRIGIGYEHHSYASLKYKSFDNDYGKDTYKFSKMSNRFYVSFRIGH